MTTPDDTTSRPDLDSFEVGAIYRHDLTGELVEYLGSAFVAALDGEDVAVFRFVDLTLTHLLVATKQDYQRGDTFTLLEDDIDENLEDFVEEATDVAWGRQWLRDTFRDGDVTEAKLRQALASLDHLERIKVARAIHAMEHDAKLADEENQSDD